MATVFFLHLYADSPIAAKSQAAAAFREVDRIESLLSAFRPDSELSRLNRDAGAGPILTDPETFRFLHLALQWSRRSSGAFDMTVGAVMKAWGFLEKGAVPSPEQLQAISRDVGWQKVELDQPNRTIRFTSHGLRLDPGGIGKGYAVDRAIDKLKSENVSAALLSAGSSSIFALGRPPGQPGWKVRVSNLDKTGDISTVLLADTSLSTANITGKYFIEGGRSYGSIMDPRTLRPVRGTSQVSVIAPSATDSDALSNALFVLDTGGRVELLSRVKDVSALVVCGTQEATRNEAIRWPAEIQEAQRAEGWASSAQQHAMQERLPA